MNTLSSVTSLLEATDGKSSEKLCVETRLSRSPIELVNTAAGKGCAEALVKRGLIGEKDEKRVAALISRASHDAVAATNEMLKQSVIDRQNMAAVSEFIKRTLRRQAWGIARPVAVGRAAHQYYRRRQAVELRRVDTSEKPFTWSR